MLVDDEGKHLDVLDETAQIGLQTASRVRAELNVLLEKEGLQTKQHFQAVMDDFAFIERELSSRLENWIDYRTRNLTTIVLRSCSNGQATALDAFTIISQGVTMFLNMLTNLPPSVAKHNLLIAEFFNRITRIILLFVEKWNAKTG
eukprot:TRINITY_DN5837_c0_g1_i3.p1 TRINITY_DN5837_c0_g1~~TRINITY_DN5837_c0_g1_i3.p1  ORF type:complete len:146 (+),score=20.89 TRINITY_DN5837_c0_g1_i3:217-654(+)